MKRKGRYEKEYKIIGPEKWGYGWHIGNENDRMIIWISTFTNGRS